MDFLILCWKSRVWSSIIFAENTEIIFGYFPQHFFPRFLSNNWKINLCNNTPILGEKNQKSKKYKIFPTINKTLIMNWKAFNTSQKIILCTNASDRLMHKEVSLWLPFLKYEYNTNFIFQYRNMNIFYIEYIQIWIFVEKPSWLLQVSINK